MSYVLLPGTGTSRVDTPDSAALSLTGDLDIRALVSLNDWTPSTINDVVGQYGTAGNQRSWRFQVNTAPGVLRFTWSVLGTSTVINVVSTVSPTVVDGAPLWIRVTHDVDNGAVGNDVTFYTSADPVETAPAAVTWVQLGTTVTTAGVTAHFNSNFPIELGAINGSAALTGRCYYAELRSSIGGTIVGSPDFRDLDQSGDSGATFVDGQANTWTVQTAAAWTRTPPTPGSPAASAVSSSQINVSWANVAGETGFRVERSLTGVGGWSNVSGSLAPNILAYSDTGLNASTQYFYRVFAFDTLGDSLPSTVVNATTQAVASGRKVLRSPRYGLTRSASR